MSCFNKISPRLDLLRMKSCCRYYSLHIRCQALRYRQDKSSYHRLLQLQHTMKRGRLHWKFNLCIQNCHTTWSGEIEMKRGIKSVFEWNVLVFVFNSNVVVLYTNSTFCPWLYQGQTVPNECTLVWLGFQHFIHFDWTWTRGLLFVNLNV